jgi:transcriptional regulator with XRE-family HTH domain
MPEFNKVVRHGLKVEMAKADMTPAELAERSGVSVDAIRQYLRGETAPLLETAYKLAAALGCTPNDLCGWGK